MTYNKKSAEAERQRRAMKLAEISVTDGEDLNKFMNEMQSHVSLSENEARIVASAFRSRMLTAYSRQEGISDPVIAQLLAEGDPMTADFAKDKHTKDDSKMPKGLAPQDDVDPLDDGEGDPDLLPSSKDEDDGDMLQDHQVEDHDVPEALDAIHPADALDADGGEDALAGEGDPTMPMAHSDDSHDDLGGADDLPIPAGDDHDADGPMATIQIEVPVSDIDKVQKALNDVLGGPADDNGFDASGEAASDMPDFGGDTAGLSPADTDAPSDSAAPVDKPAPFDKAASAARRTQMSKDELARRAAQREALLAHVRTASEEDGKPRDIGLGKDTSGNGKPFQFDSEAQYKGEDKFGKLTMENSEGNSLKGQNPTFAKQTVPTNNPQNLQLSESLQAVKLDGSPDGTLSYDPDFDFGVPIPSADPDRGNNFDLPTQMDVTLDRSRLRNTTACQGCNNPTRVAVNWNECQDCGTRIAICQTCEDDGYCPACRALGKQASDDNVDEGKTDNGEDKKRRQHQFDGTEMPQSARDKDHPFEEGDPNAGSDRAAEVFKARIKTAYSVSYKLALAGLLEANEIDTNVEDYMNSGMSASTMLKQGGMWLRSAQNATQRVLAAHADKQNVRTASNGLATNPSFQASSTSVSPAVMDLHTALQGLWTMPKIDEE
jgi:hypothetical protein